MIRVLRATPVMLVVFAAILALCALAMRTGLLLDDSVQLWASAIAAGDGELPIGRIVSVYPSIPYLATTLLELLTPAAAPTPALVTALVIAILAGLWYLALRDAGFGTLATCSAVALIAFHPALLRAATAGPADAFLVAFLALFAKGLYDLRATSAAPDVMTVCSRSWHSSSARRPRWWR